MIKRFILGLSVATILLVSCDNKEKARLEAQNDSLRTELQTSQQLASTLNEVGSLLDSIDANRQMLRTDVVEGTTYTDYAARLRSLNSYIRETKTRINELEQTAQKSKSSSASYASTIKKLRMDLESRTQQIAALEEEVNKMRTENASLAMTVNQRDSVLAQNTEIIKMREQDIVSLEKNVEDINMQAKLNQADAYFAQALALETAAQRTKFAPRKKKETQREALELYKLAFSLGKEEAQPKIEELEKSTS